MNERIKELALQARQIGEYVNYGQIRLSTEQFEQKFAELIVRECAQYMYEHYPHTRYETNYMRKHMGDPNWNRPIEVESIDSEYNTADLNPKWLADEETFNDKFDNDF